MMADPTLKSARRALVVAPHGFLAGHLVLRLRLAGIHVAGVGRRPDPPLGLDSYLPVPFDSAEATGRLKEFIGHEAPDWIFHLAGAPCGSAVGSVAANIQPASVVLDAAATAAPDASIVVTGSAAEYGAPANPAASITEDHTCAPQNFYGATKLAQTHLALEAGRRGSCVAVVRPFNLVGPGISPAFFPGAIAQRAQAALATGAAEIEVGNLDTERDFIAVEDTVSALLLIADARASGEIFNICSGEPTRMRTMLEAILAGLPRPLGYRVNPAFVRPTDAPRVIGSAAKLRSRLGWKPVVPLADSLRATIAHALSRRP